MLLHRLFSTQVSANKYQTNKYFSTTFLNGWVLHRSLLHSVIKHAILNTEILQGSVAMHLKCGGMFNNDFIANSLMSLPVKEFWKSVNIWRSYRQKSSVLFFLVHSIIMKGILLELLQDNITGILNKLAGIIQWVGTHVIVSCAAGKVCSRIFVLKRDVKHQLTNQRCVLLTCL